MTDASGSCLLRAADLHLSFGPARALAAASFTLRAGEIVAVVGPSGSGKSTLLHCLSGMVVPDEGEVWFHGSPVHTMSEHERSVLRRTRFGVLFQFGQLVAELTAEENVALPLLLAGSRRRSALRAAAEQLDAVGIGDLARRRPTEMSGGEAQRAALARALVTEPEVLFADEPTGALDSAAGASVLRLIEGAATRHGTGVVLVTHDQDVARVAHRRVAMADGRSTVDA